MINWKKLSRPSKINYFNRKLDTVVVDQINIILDKEHRIVKKYFLSKKYGKQIEVMLVSPNHQIIKQVKVINWENRIAKAFQTMEILSAIKA